MNDGSVWCLLFQIWATRIANDGWAHFAIKSHCVTFLETGKLASVDHSKWDLVAILFLFRPLHSYVESRKMQHEPLILAYLASSVSPCGGLGFKVLLNIYFYDMQVCDLGYILCLDQRCPMRGLDTWVLQTLKNVQLRIFTKIQRDGNGNTFSCHTIKHKRHKDQF